MKRTLALVTIAAGLIAQPVLLAPAAGADIMLKPSHWRGTLLEGTDAIIATNKYGEPLFVESGDTVAPMFTPAPMTGDRLATEFKRLCIDTALEQTKLADAVSGSSFSLTNRKLTVPAVKNGAPYEASVWHSPEARVQIWSGDVSGLNNRQTLSRWRNGATAGPFKDTRMFSPACNLTVMANGFHDPQPFIAAMTKILGAEPAKVVTKTAWADGHWLMTGGGGTQTRVGYSMVDLDRGEQLLHVAIAPMPAKKGK